MKYDWTSKIGRSVQSIQNKDESKAFLKTPIVNWTTQFQVDIRTAQRLWDT
jgi:hypothetical protein